MNPPQITVDLSELEEFSKEIKKIEPAFLEQIWDGVLQISLETEKEVKDRTPIDTGRAKAGWGHWTPQDIQNPASTKGSAIKNALSYFRKYPRRKIRGTGASGRSQLASADDAIWEEDKAALTVTQGTRVPYM